MRRRRIVTAAAVLAVLALPATAAAHHPDAGEIYVPWMDKLTEQRNLAAFSADSSAAAAAAPPGISGMTLVGNADKDGTTNSDLAFYGNLAYAGNYNGFRILDITADQPNVVRDFTCRGPQNDVSIAKLGPKRFLFQSIDSGQTREDCLSADAPVIDGGRVGYEGVRVFDVTNPRKPVFVDMIQTACGSHTHTLIPAGGRTAYIYVSSYPLGTGVTPPGAEGPGDYRPCRAPHSKISIIRVTNDRSGFDFDLKEQPLSEDTAFNRGFQACHDVQVFMATDTALGSCAGDAQLWDVSDPWNPTTDVEGEHTHIHSPSAADQFEFIHSGVVTWDGKYFAIMDETGGGVGAFCDGAASQHGFYYFYEMVEPGDPAPQLLSRYTIPRPQTPEICVSHNATVLPLSDRYVMSAAYYQGGVSLVEFSDVTNPSEIAYADLEDATGLADEWSSYWYNGRIYSNSGLDRRGATQNRGLDVYELDPGLGIDPTATWAYSNPQTQEAWQRP